jgi:integrase
VLRINDTKFGKDRLVPPALPLVQRLQKYAAEIGRQPADAYFFPSPRGGHWSSSAIYWMFRELLMRCRIAHGGRGQGPRIHDLRHNSESRIIPSTAWVFVGKPCHCLTSARSGA